MRAAEFKRLGDETYVDHAGATLPSEKQLEDVFKVSVGTKFGCRVLFWSRQPWKCAWPLFTRPNHVLTLSECFREPCFKT